MSIPTLEQLMSTSISELAAYTLLEIGDYHGVITNVESRPGKKAPFLNVEVTIHGRADGSEDGRTRKVWRNVSFSEKAINMPAGVAQLVQSTSPEVPSGTSAEGLPGALAVAIQGSPVGITIGHEEAYDGNASDNVKRDPQTGEAIMRESIDAFFEAPKAFVDGFEAEAAGNDSDLPF